MEPVTEQTKMPYIQLEAEYNNLRRHHDATVRAVQIKQGEINALYKDNAYYKEQLENANKAFQIQKQITVDNITQSQEVINNLSNEIIGLKKRIKELEG